MPLRDVFRKKEDTETPFISPPQSPTSSGLPPSSPAPAPPPKDRDTQPSHANPHHPIVNEPPTFTIVRTTTTTEEVIQPPSFHSDDGDSHANHASHASYVKDNNGDGRPGGLRNSRLRWSSFSSSRRLSKQSINTDDEKMRDSETAGGDGACRENVDSNSRRNKDEKRLSDRLHLRSPRLRARSSSTASSVNLPGDLAELELEEELKGKEDEDREAEWEKRATVLGMARAGAVSRDGSRQGSVASLTASVVDESGSGGRRNNVRRGSSVGDEKKDSEIQEAIRLHEEGHLERSSALFGKLADPNGANNPLSQVLYGLALRHGWGCRPDAERALTYLSYAASNSADIESIALGAGMKKGGAAKGELVLAIFELGNCFRHAWGVPKKDPVAARHYYETAANLGDVDAMNEVAWCYVEGFGCRKDKHKAAQYLRRAEEKGGKAVGNSCFHYTRLDRCEIGLAHELDVIHKNKTT